MLNNSPAPADRMKWLVAERRRKMAASAHAYVRGSTERFYEWLEASGRPAIPEGPSIWICGDCHVGNLGPVASKDGGLAIQIRDLDQTVIGSHGQRERQPNEVVCRIQRAVLISQVSPRRE